MTIRNTILLLLLTIVISQPVLSRPTIKLNYAATVMYVCNSNTIVVTNLYKHNIETVVLARTVVSSNRRRDYLGQCFLERACLGQTVNILSYGYDKYGRVVADVKTPCGWWLSYELIAGGYVYWWPAFDRNDAGAMDCQRFAQRRKSGVWGICH
jgi:hypothetical protein